MSDAITLPDIDQYTNGALLEPYDDSIKVDYLGLRNYIKEKYNGDSSKMTQEENDLFIVQDNKRKTA